MADKSKILQAIYVELDVLLDTRMGTIARISEAAAENTLHAGYHTRDTDVFSQVDMETYKTLYSTRDVNTLAKSTLTGAIPFLKRIAGALTEQAIQQPHHEGAKLIVNLFPYQLSQEEEDEIGKAVAAWMRGLALVELVTIPPDRLTPEHCKQSYAAMMMYNYEDWMNLHAAAFKQTILPQVTLFAPAIYFGKKPTDEELQREMREAAHPLKAIEMLASPLIGLTLIEIQHFSVISAK